MTIADQERARAGYIAGLRQLADLLEQVPELPCDDSGSVWSVLRHVLQGVVYELIDRAAAALDKAGIAYEHHAGKTYRQLDVVLAGVRYSVSRVSDASYAAYKAQRSYEDNVQVAA